jgi:hypothetical protein
MAVFSKNLRQDENLIRTQSERDSFWIYTLARRRYRCSAQPNNFY